MKSEVYPQIQRYFKISKYVFPPPPQIFAHI